MQKRLRRYTSKVLMTVSFSPREVLNAVITCEWKIKNICWLHQAIVLQFLLQIKHPSKCRELESLPAAAAFKE